MHCNEFSAHSKIEVCQFISDCYINGNLIEKQLPGGAFWGCYVPSSKLEDLAGAEDQNILLKHINEFKLQPGNVVLPFPTGLVVPDSDRLWAAKEQ